jgi:uncharacterized protein (DUF169 family)
MATSEQILSQHEQVSRLEQLLTPSEPFIAAAFLESPPVGIEKYHGPDLPSSCSFWPLAAKSSFYTERSDHQGCAIGLMTMGFGIGREEHEQALPIMSLMSDLGYMCEADLESLNKVAKPHAYIAYGPATQFALPADLVVGFLNPFQMMLTCEAIGETQMKLAGKPGCNAWPTAINAATHVLSVGCIGARTYAGIGPDKVMLTLPASSLEAFLGDLEQTVRANTRLAEFHREKKNSYC